MDIKKERLEEIVKEELEAFYEGEVPMEEGAGSKIADVIAKLTGKYTPKDPDLEAEEQAEKAKQRKQEQIAALVADLKGRSKGLTPKEFTRQMAFLRKALDKSEV